MPQVTSSETETFMRALSLMALLLCMAPLAFGRSSVLSRAWLHRAAAATLALASVIACAAIVRWFLR